MDRKKLIEKAMNVLPDPNESAEGNIKIAILSEEFPAPKFSLFANDLDFPHHEPRQLETFIEFQRCYVTKTHIHIGKPEGLEDYELKWIPSEYFDTKIPPQTTEEELNQVYLSEYLLK